MSAITNQTNRPITTNVVDHELSELGACYDLLLQKVRQRRSQQEGAGQAAEAFTSVKNGETNDEAPLYDVGGDARQAPK